jgi:hypothetical protein
MDEARLCHVTVGVWMATVLLDVATMVAQSAPLQQLAAVCEMALLVTPATAIRNTPVVDDPRLSNKLLTL